MRSPVPGLKSQGFGLISYKTSWDAGSERGFSPIVPSRSSGFNRSQSLLKLGYE
jgi:hypothetical protein